MREHRKHAEHLMLGDEIVGTWRLVSYTAQDDRGGPVRYPLGPDAVGLIMYTHDGYMSAQLMRRDRPDYDLPGTPTTEQAATAAAGYLAYGGPYQVDESTGVVHHEVAVSLLPNWLNTAQLRDGALAGDRLTLAADLPADEVTIRATLVWARAPRHTTNPANNESPCEIELAAPR
jgi:Lipocalin-like domain